MHVRMYSTCTEHQVAVPGALQLHVSPRLAWSINYHRAEERKRKAKVGEQRNAHTPGGLGKYFKTGGRATMRLTMHRMSGVVFPGGLV